MDEHWPSPTPRDEIYARVMNRARSIRNMRRLIYSGIATGLVAIGAVGYFLGASGTVGAFAGTPATMPDAQAPYSTCPDTGPIGELHRGDRVLILGRNAKGDWLQIRSPLDLRERVWIRATSVTPDADHKLPKVTCGPSEQKVQLANGRVITSTTVPSAKAKATSTTSTTTTTVAPGATTAPTGPQATIAPGSPGQGSQPSGTKPPGTKPPGPTAPPPTTQRPPDPPLIGTLHAKPTTIWERYPGSDVCGKPGVSTVTVAIAHATSATLHWNAPGRSSGTRSMTRSGSTYSAKVGPFGVGDPYDPPRSIKIWVTATGPGGTRTSGAIHVTLDDCTFG